MQIGKTLAYKIFCYYLLNVLTLSLGLHYTPSKNLIKIPQSFYRQWGTNLSTPLLLEDDTSNKFDCLIETHEAHAYFRTNTSAIRQLYDIPDGGVLKIIYLGRNRFNFFIPLPEKHRVRSRTRSNQQMHHFNDDTYLWTIHVNPNYENQFLVTFLPSNLLNQHHFHFVNSWPFIHFPLGINVCYIIGCSCTSVSNKF